MTVRTIKVYYLGNAGHGCFRKDLPITTDNFITETADTITVWEPDLDAWGSTQEREAVYCKNLDFFIKRENERFANHIAEITERHKTTLRMANELKNKDLTISKDRIPL